MPTPPPFYPLIPAPPTPPANEPGGAPSNPTPQSSFRAFLGYGLVTPFRRDKKRDFANGGGVDVIRSCVSQILGTRCSGSLANGTEEQGEIEWAPEFGSLLYRMAHRKGVILQELAWAYIVEALRRWEPRVTITDATTSFDNSTRELTVHIRYNVIDQNVPGNNVILQGVEQTIVLPLAA